MAEGTNEKKEDGGWWGYGLLQAAKEKSKAALEMVQKDLAEYTCTMSADTSKAVAKTSDKLKETLKAENTSVAKDRFKTGVTSFLEGLSKALVIEAEDLEKPATTPVSTEAVYDRAKARLHAIQVDPETYCREPSGSPEKYKEWRKSFDLEEYKGEVSELLVSKVELRAFYTKLVPAEISHADFWSRYFYKVHQLQQDEARKLALMKRAEQAQKKEDSISWEDDWSGDEESASEKVSRKHELSERLSPQQGTQKVSPINQTESTLGNRTAPENQTDAEGKVNCIDQDTDKEQTPSEKEKESVVPEGKENSKGTSDEKDISNLPPQTVHESENQDIDLNGTSQSEAQQEKAAVVKDIPTTEKSKSDMAEKDVKTKDKGDMVVINPDRVTPDSNKENSTDDDWERDFDVELTEEELKAADEIAKKLNLSAADYTNIAGDMDEDWESWE